jgi:CRP/FNR family transcriptional regulator, cyclic AMP receptor protein
MAPVLDATLMLQQLSSLPLEVHQPGSVVLAAGATTGKLLVLKEGAVEIRLDGVRIAEVSDPGAVFGELGLLLGQPHTADVLALRPSTFHVAEGGTFLRVNPGAALYVAIVLAHRLDAVNRHLVEARGKLEPAAHGRVFDQMVENISEALRYGPPL